MNLETFLHHLHFETEKIFPNDWRVDWEDAPLPYKLYRGLPEISMELAGEFPLETRAGHGQKPDINEIGCFLWHVYGLTQYAQTSSFFGKEGKVHQSLRRFIPSGGALYPNELYLYLKLENLTQGIYHYSNAHHRLVLLREGNFDSYISQSVGNSCDIEACFGTVFVTTVFWKNFFKYHNFSYRLQGLDAGVILGQLLETAARLGYSTSVCYQFLDQPLNHLLGLKEEDENVYAVVPLNVDDPFISNDSKKENVSAAELIRELPELKHDTYQRSKIIIDYPMMKKLNSASMIDSTAAFSKLSESKRVPTCPSIETVMLPFSEPLLYDFTAICEERHSPESDFFLRKITQTELAVLLKEVFSFVYHSDLDEIPGSAGSRLNLYGCFYQTEGVSNGAYYYDCRHHGLWKIAEGDFREYLYSGLTIDNVNLFQVPLIFHIIGGNNHYNEKLGYRGYRIQQMEAGILVQRLLLAAAALGLGGHPLLGYDVKLCDELYQLKEDTSLIQIPIGPYRPRAWLKGSLKS